MWHKRVAFTETFVLSATTKMFSNNSIHRHNPSTIQFYWGPLAEYEYVQLGIKSEVGIYVTFVHFPRINWTQSNLFHPRQWWWQRCNCCTKQRGSLCQICFAKLIFIITIIWSLIFIFLHKHILTKCFNAALHFFLPCLLRGSGCIEAATLINCSYFTATSSTLLLL